MMIFFLPILFAVAGTCITLLFSNRIRQYKALAFKARQPDRDRVVVKGHTYSEAVSGDGKLEFESGSARLSSDSKGLVEHARRVCIIGAGKEGAITGIVLALHNPEVEFCIADSDERLIRAWNSDTLPFSEPGLEETFFDDEALHARAEDGREDEKPGITDQDDDQDLHGSARKESIAHVERRRRLSNLSFSTDVHAAVVPAELIFLCLEMDPSAGAFDDSLPHCYLDSTLQSIALASAGDKIIVQRSTAPYGATAYIGTRLRKISSPKASYTVLANPALAPPLPGSLISSMLAPSSVMIGHIFSPTTSTSAITALKRLYASFVPDDRIVTMDAYSAELGAISTKAVLVQQVVSLDSVRLICDRVEASAGNVRWILGGPDMAGERGRWMRREVRCLVDLAAGLGMEEVKAYWEGVLRMERMKYRRDVRDLVRVLEVGLKRKKVALILMDVIRDREMVLLLLDELRKAEVVVRVWVDRASREHQIPDVLRNVSGSFEDIVVVDSLEDACVGCNAAVLHGSLQIGDDAMQVIAGRMEEPKALLSLEGGANEMKMRHLGFRLV
ncbi:hypothetical protein BDV10DRAFT_176714 [Aspergillus recurvatus]